MSYLRIKQSLSVLPVALVIAIVCVSCGKRTEIIKTSMRPELSLVSKAQEDASRHLSDGVAFFRSGKCELARDHLVKSIGLAPSDWMAHYYLGLVEISLVMLPKAEGSLHKALSQAPKDNRTRSRIYVALGQLAQMNGQLGQARLDFQMALNLWPQSAAARLELDRLRQRSEQTGD